MFCGCAADWFGKEPNTVCCPVCLGLPGALPVPNKRAVEWCVMLGLALNCEIPLHSKFDRKNYFYPDLPKGYQISQYDQPFAINGYLDIDTRENAVSPKDSSAAAQNGNGTKRIRIRRVHMEEDTGKLLHTTVDGKPATLIDFNRSGVPLVEIVTEPDIHSGEEARVFLKKLHQLIRHLGISDADMEKGSMRLEPNISIRPIGSNGLPSYKVEVKNINSFSFAKKAIEYEVQRHAEILHAGNTPKQETRGWNEKQNKTVSQRSKEEAADYRYFPDPDIPPIVWSQGDIERISTLIGELPDKKRDRYINSFALSPYDAGVLVDNVGTAAYFEEAVRALQSSDGKTTVKTLANWIINRKVDTGVVSPRDLVKAIAEKEQVVHMGDDELASILRRVIEANPKACADYLAGKEGSIMYIIGQVMREVKGKADAATVKERILQELKKRSSDE